MSDVQYRAEQAQRLLSEPLFQEARALVVQALQTEVLSLPLAERERREAAVAMLKGAEQFFRVFELVIDGYKLERAEMANEAQMKARHQAIEERMRNA
ncbi:hypothetical protein [Comamonas sp. GB3 AK4-5]|uniref:hypothetical protein n=1 Tax=Comamonas sp. GB3 AK4-5 TaxID=3231487 RepID=UPI00351F3FFB